MNLRHLSREHEPVIGRDRMDSVKFGSTNLKRAAFCGISRYSLTTSRRLVQFSYQNIHIQPIRSALFNHVCVTYHQRCKKRQRPETASRPKRTDGGQFQASCDQNFGEVDMLLHQTSCRCCPWTGLDLS